MRPRRVSACCAASSSDACRSMRSVKRRSITWARHRRAGPVFRRFALTVCCAVFLLAALQPRLAAQAQLVQGVGDSGVYATKLGNGLQVIVVEDHAAPVVHTSVWYRFGSLYETPGKTGLAHALEHMMFRGTPEISAGGMDDIVARLGAQMNGTTDYDYTDFLFDMPADRAAIALQIEA